MRVLQLNKLGHLAFNEDLVLTEFCQDRAKAKEDAKGRRGWPPLELRQTELDNRAERNGCAHGVWTE
jgi:hypothetical protein